MWDTAGQERYHSLAPVFIRGSQIIFLTFDLTNQKSLNDLFNIWLPIIKKQLDREQLRLYKYCRRCSIGKENG